MASATSHCALGVHAVARLNRAWPAWRRSAVQTRLRRWALQVQQGQAAAQMVAAAMDSSCLPLLLESAGINTVCNTWATGAPLASCGMALMLPTAPPGERSPCQQPPQIVRWPNSITARLPEQWGCCEHEAGMHGSASEAAAVVRKNLGHAGHASCHGLTVEGTGAPAACQQQLVCVFCPQPPRPPSFRRPWRQPTCSTCFPLAPAAPRSTPWRSPRSWYPALMPP